MLERFKAHPAVAPLLAGGEMIEYSGHMIPEFGPETMPKIYGNGVMFVGDSAGLVTLSPFYHEGHEPGDGLGAGGSGNRARTSRPPASRPRLPTWPPTSAS